MPGLCSCLFPLQQLAAKRKAPHRQGSDVQIQQTCFANTVRTLATIQAITYSKKAASHNLQCKGCCLVFIHDTNMRLLKSSKLVFS